MGEGWGGDKKSVNCLLESLDTMTGCIVYITHVKAFVLNLLGTVDLECC